MHTCVQNNTDWRSLDIYTALLHSVRPDEPVGSTSVASVLPIGLSPLPRSQQLHLLQSALDLAGDHHIMSLGELLAALPSEVRVHIFCLALGLRAAGALLRHWLDLALVSQDMPNSLQSAV